MSLIVEAQLRRRDVVASAPLQDLRLAVFLSSLSLVEALERTVASLIEAPGLVVGNEQTAHLFRDGVVSLDGTLQDGCVSQVKLEAVLLEELTSGLGLLDTLSSQVDIMPAGEAVLEVPGRLPVANEDNFVKCVSSAHPIN